MEKGKPFLEVLATSLNEDYRFPILEIFAFFYIIGTFLLAVMIGGVTSMTGEVYTYTLVSSMSGLPAFIFLIIILKNIAYGLGNDLEKGVVQTMFSYPLKRRSILTAKLLSALGVAILLFVGTQIFALFLLAPNVIAANLDVVFVTFAGTLSQTLLIAGLVLLLTLWLKRGGIALVMGIVLYFAFEIVSVIFLFIVLATGSLIAVKIYAVIDPSLVIGSYYSGGQVLGSLSSQSWIPGFSDVILYLVAAYTVIAAVFVVAYMYFDRKFGV
jgi:ABC-type transport system involved in multi-copper enzyme maturation permease subunit